jgi:N-acetylmuramoyl-L-alanine amidase
MKKNYKIIIPALALLFMLPGMLSAQSITGLSNMKLFLDPGHSQKENMGLYNYTEAEKVLRVALALREMFFTQTDIDTVYMCRLTDNDLISLQGRTDLANSLGVDFYYSIHSDAGSPAANSTLMLYGGWRNNGVTIEKTPNGGAAFGEILNADLSGAMRIATRGNYADRVFYLGLENTHTNQYPYLHVNRETNMASLLSEAGFHTNPRQQQLNMNAEWKILEALSAFRSFLEFKNISRPPIGIVTGIITDVETGLPANGVTVKIGEKEYTTDSYSSLFNKYSTDPQQLRNGFYWIDSLSPASNVQVDFSSTDFQSKSENITLVSNPNGRTHENLSFLDVSLTSVVPAVVSSVEPADKLNSLRPTVPLIIKFSRKMDKSSVESAISILPAAGMSFTWPDDFTMEINTSQFEFETQYTISIDGTIAKNQLTNQFLDGDANGTEGGNYQLMIQTSPQDTEAPVLTDYSPDELLPVTEARPVIRLVFNEPVTSASLGSNAVTLSLQGGNAVSGEIHHVVINNQSVVHFFPSADLAYNKAYTVQIAAGLSDEFGNLTEAQSFQFILAEQPLASNTLMDQFDAITNWWQPQQSGSTAGIVTEQTNQGVNNTFLYKVVPTTGSMRLSYGWDINHAGPYIRLYLPPTAAQNAVKFNKDDLLQVFMFGDGSNNQFRFMIRDGNNTLEASPWYTINWLGWKLVSWDMTNDPAYGWVNGNGVLDGSNFYLDGFHFRYVTGGNQSGSLYFEDLRFVKKGTTVFPETLFESFETYADFTTHLFPWKTVDVKGDITWNPQGFSFPGSGQPYAFKVLNPKNTTAPIDQAHPAQHGEKYLIAMQSQTIDDDKWFISPQLKIKENSKLKFFAKSISDEFGLERFQVLVDEDESSNFTFNAANFTKISTGDYVEAPLSWTKYEYDLEPYMDKIIRFAIHGVSHDSYMLMLDAIEVYLYDPQTAIENLEKVKYRLYPVPASDFVYVETDVPVTEFRISDMSGKLVKIVKAVGNKTQIPLSDLQTGTYLIGVVSGKNVHYQKMLITR